jgi:hypothetical protein
MAHQQSFPHNQIHRTRKAVPLLSADVSTRVSGRDDGIKKEPGHIGRERIRQRSLTVTSISGTYSAPSPKTQWRSHDHQA